MPIYRRDLAPDYVAYWEVLTEAGDFIIISAGPKTGRKMNIHVHECTYRTRSLIDSQIHIIPECRTSPFTHSQIHYSYSSLSSIDILSFLFFSSFVIRQDLFVFWEPSSSTHLPMHHIYIFCNIKCLRHYTDIAIIIQISCLYERLNVEIFSGLSEPSSCKIMNTFTLMLHCYT